MSIDWLIVTHWYSSMSFARRREPWSGQTALCMNTVTGMVTSQMMVFTASHNKRTVLKCGSDRPVVRTLWKRIYTQKVMTESHNHKKWRMRYIHLGKIVMNKICCVYFHHYVWIYETVVRKTYKGKVLPTRFKEALWNRFILQDATCKMKNIDW